MILGERRLREPMFCPSWEGDRVICIESGMKNDDLPEGVISQECRDFVSDSEEEEVVLTFVQWAKETFETSLFQRYFLKDIFYGLDGSDLYKAPRSHGRLVVPKDVRVILDFIRRMTDVHERVFVRDVVVLLNLTKKVYVRLSPAIDKIEDSEVTIPDNFHLLGTLLLIPICWSSDPSTSMGHKGEDLHRGSWAGDRFEFTRKDVLDSRLEQEKGEWKDASKEVVDLLQVLYCTSQR